jgi:hypothetical protein
VFVTLVAMLCKMSAQDCTEIAVTNSHLDTRITFQRCLTSSQAGLALWKSAHPIYRSGEWYIDRDKCVMGSYIAHAKI